MPDMHIGMHTKVARRTQLRPRLQQGHVRGRYCTPRGDTIRPRSEPKLPSEDAPCRLTEVFRGVTESRDDMTLSALARPRIPSARTAEMYAKL